MVQIPYFPWLEIYYYFFYLTVNTPIKLKLTIEKTTAFCSNSSFLLPSISVLLPNFLPSVAQLQHFYNGDYETILQGNQVQLYILWFVTFCCFLELIIVTKLLPTPSLSSFSWNTLCPLIWPGILGIFFITLLIWSSVSWITWLILLDFIPYFEQSTVSRLLREKLYISQSFFRYKLPENSFKKKNKETNRKPCT